MADQIIRYYDQAARVTIPVLLTDLGGGNYGWAGGSGTPGGSDTQVQFNNAGAFGGDAGLTYNLTTNTLTAGAFVSSGAVAGTITLSEDPGNGTNTITIQAPAAITSNVTQTLPDTTGVFVLDTATQTLTNKTLTTPTLTTPRFVNAGSINDSNGNELLRFGVTSSAINELLLTNGATGQGPIMEPTGGDTNISVEFRPKGAGVIRLLGSSTQAGLLSFREVIGNGTNEITIASPAAITSNVTQTLPDAAGAFVLDTATQTLTNKTLTAPVISSIINTGTLTLPTSTDTLVGKATTDTFTNKRVTPRVGTTASSSTPTPDADAHDIYTVTALAANATFGAPTGTPTDGQSLMIRVKDNGTARTLAYNAIYRAVGIALPTTTVISKTTYIGAIFNSADTKWDCIGTVTEA